MHAAEAAEGTPWLCTLPQGALRVQLALLHLTYLNLHMAAKGAWLEARLASSEGSQGRQHVVPNEVLADDASCCMLCQMALTVCSMAFPAHDVVEEGQHRDGALLVLAEAQEPAGLRVLL